MLRASLLPSTIDRMKESQEVKQTSDSSDAFLPWKAAFLMLNGHNLTHINIPGHCCIQRKFVIKSWLAVGCSPPRPPLLVIFASILLSVILLCSLCVPQKHTPFHYPSSERQYADKHVILIGMF